MYVDTLSSGCLLSLLSGNYSVKISLATSQCILDGAVAMVYDALQTSTRLLSEVVAFHRLSVSLEEKCTIDKLLWRQ